MATLALINVRLCTHMIFLLLHHSYIVCVLFVSDTNLDCIMVHVPYIQYHNSVTSANPGKSRHTLPLSFQGSEIRNEPEKMAGTSISFS